MQTAELSPTRSDSAIGQTEVKKSRRARRSASAIEEDTNTAATPNGGKDLCETPTPLLAVKKTSPTGAVVVAGANCMPVASSVMQQEPQKQQRAHTKSSNANSSSKNASDAVKQLEVCNSAHATDDDDVFYDARSEDSGGTAHSAASSNLLRQQGTATVKSRNERCSLLRDMTATSPESNRGQHKEAQQKQPQGWQQRFASGSDIISDTYSAVAPLQSGPVNDEDNATTAQTKSKDTLAATSESVRTERTTKSATTKSDEANAAAKCAQAGAEAEAEDVTNVATNGATGSSAMALNLDEATTATVATTALASEQHKDVGGSGSAGGGRDSHSRREKKRRGASSSNSRESSSRQHKAAATPVMTISCDTCCQVECEQYQQQQQQQQPKTPQQKQQQTPYPQASRRHESRAESKNKISKERANKIKDDKSRESNEATTTVTASGGAVAPLERGEQSTITTTMLTNKAKDATKLGDSMACAAAMLPSTRAAAAEEYITQQTAGGAAATTTTTTTSTTNAPATAAQPQAAAIVAPITNPNQIGAQTDNKSECGENAKVYSSMSPQHVAEPVTNSSAATEQAVSSSLTSLQNETIPALVVGRPTDVRKLSTTATPTKATIIITPAEPTAGTAATITQLTTTTPTNDTSAPAMECATLAAQLLTAATKSTATLTPTATASSSTTTTAMRDATVPTAATTSPATSAANSTASCISDIAGVATLSY
ncbi:PREDICTED: mucin-5AC-like, partial [Rhagoletis zephyria]|uniref:mucin-5AC-like n=1 Tax=Rhagoletis zephyria TaxID=28612 RepID=UPI0008117107